MQLTLLRDGQTTEASVPVYIHKLAVAPHLNNGMPSYLMVRVCVRRVWGKGNGNGRSILKPPGHPPTHTSNAQTHTYNATQVGGMVFTVLTHPFLLSNLGETYAPESQADVRLLYLIQCNLRHHRG